VGVVKCVKHHILATCFDISVIIRLYHISFWHNCSYYYELARACNVYSKPMYLNAHISNSACRLILVTYFFGLLFSPEYGNSTSLSKAGKFHRSTRRHIPTNSILHGPRSENIRYVRVRTVFTFQRYQYVLRETRDSNTWRTYFYQE
jgi:hypothetical protein